MVCLDDPILTDEAKEGVKSLLTDRLDSDGRSYKKAMKMITEDGIFTVLPKSDDAWIKLLNPFLRLTTKEKNKTIIKFKIK